MTAVDRLAGAARVQDDGRVFVPGTGPATAVHSIAPRVETAYTENVEPYL